MSKIIKNVTEKAEAYLQEPKVQKTISYLNAQRCNVRSYIIDQFPFVTRIKGFLLKKGLLKDEPLIQAILITLLLSFLWSAVGAVSKVTRVTGRVWLFAVQIAILSIILASLVQYKDFIYAVVDSLLARLE